MTKILLTGATGFLGKALCLDLLKNGYEVRGTYRSSFPTEPEFSKVEWVKIPDLFPSEIWDKPLEGCDVVIHAAARVHQMNTTKADEELFYKDNVLGTKALVEAVVRNGMVKQFIFVSTILVYGKWQSMPLNSNEICFPDTPYGKSKLAAEHIVRSLFVNTSVVWTIFRPALIYGYGVKGNLAIIEKLIKKGIPIPVKGLKNKRSLLSIYNMLEFVKAAILNGSAQNQIFCVGDCNPVSTERIVLSVAKFLKRDVRVIQLPFFIVYTVAILCDIMMKLGLSIPWGRVALAKIYGDFWFDTSYSIRSLRVEGKIDSL